jgi:hypothetical protein
MTLAGAPQGHPPLRVLLLSSGVDHQGSGPCASQSVLVGPSGPMQAICAMIAAASAAVAETHFSLTFCPSDGTVQSVQAPIVPPVGHGVVISVHYDLSGLTGATDPVFVVSYRGRVDPSTGLLFRPAYTAALNGTSGTVDVPVSVLPGGGSSLPPARE